MSDKWAMGKKIRDLLAWIKFIFYRKYMLILKSYFHSVPCIRYYKWQRVKADSFHFPFQVCSLPFLTLLLAWALLFGTVLTGFLILWPIAGLSQWEFSSVCMRARGGRGLSIHLLGSFPTESVLTGCIPLLKSAHRAGQLCLQLLFIWWHLTPLLTLYVQE